MSKPEELEATPGLDSLRPGTRLVLAVLVLLGAWVRGAAFQDWWINPDEGFYYLAATGSWETCWGIIYRNAHPPLCYLILRACAVVSDAFAVMRLPAYLAGILTIPAGFLLGRELAGDHRHADRSGLVLAFGLCVIPGVVIQGQLLRPYSLLLLLVTLAAWALSRFLRCGRSSDLVAYSLLLSIALVTHYSAALFAAASFLVLVAARLAGRASTLRPTRLVAAYLLPGAVVAGALYWHLVPFLLGAAEDLGPHLRHALRPTGPLHACRLLGSALFDSLGMVAPGKMAQGLAVPLVIAGLALAWSRGRRTQVVWVGGALLAASLAFVSGKYPLDGTRRCLWMAPILLLPIAEVLGVLLSSGRALSRILGVVALVVLWGEPASVSLRWQKPAYLMWEQMIPRTEAEACIQYVEGLPDGVLATFGGSTRFLLAPVLSESGPASSWSRRLSWGGRDVIQLFRWVVRLDRLSLEELTLLRDKVAEVSGADPAGPAEVVYVSTRHSPSYQWVTGMVEGEDGVLETKVSNAMCAARIDLSEFLQSRRAAAPQE